VATAADVDGRNVVTEVDEVTNDDDDDNDDEKLHFFVLVFTFETLLFIILFLL